MSYQPRSTNPYIMEKKLNECVGGGGGGFDPSVLEEIETEISVLGSENATMTQDIVDIKGSLNSINDNLTDGIGGTTDKFRFGTDGNGNYGYIKKVEGADTFFPFSKSEILVNLADFIIQHSSGNYNKTTGVYNSSNDITVVNNITNAGGTYYVDVIDLTITFTAKRKCKLLLNGNCEISQNRNQTVTLTVKHNDDTIYSNSITNIDSFNVADVYDIDAEINDTLTVKLNANNNYNYSFIGVTLF